MRDRGVRPVYVSVNSRHEISADDGKIQIADIFGTEQSGADIRFEFETPYEPYQAFSSSSIPAIDVVVKDSSGTFRRPIEVKLTVVPDSATAGKEESEWSAEIVIRPVSSAYAVMSLWEQIKDKQDVRRKIKDALDPVCQSMSGSGWDNRQEIISNERGIAVVLRDALGFLQPYQRPYLMQPVWKTDGIQPELASRCLDVFSWSDLAVVELPLLALLDQIPEALPEMPSVNDGRRRQTVDRTFREAARHVRCLYTLCTADRYNYDLIYRGMPLGHQTDKSFAIGGNKSIRYLRHARLQNPHFPPAILSELILNGGERCLSPERRFDATIFYAYRNLSRPEL